MPVQKNDIKDIAGKVAIVTGSNSGVGYESALELARAGANVIVAARNPTKGAAAAARITKAIAGAGGQGVVEFMQMDLASLASIEAFAAAFQKKHKSLQILMLNAG